MEDPLGKVAAIFKEQYITTDDGWKLRTLNWEPTDSAAAQNRPVIVVAGWTSVIEGWHPMLLEWVETRPIHYIETREKNRTQTPLGHRQRAKDFTIEQHSHDLAAVTHNLGLDCAGAVTTVAFKAQLF